jgi:hypothetical protein
MNRMVRYNRTAIQRAASRRNLAIARTKRKYHHMSPQTKRRIKRTAIGVGIGVGVAGIGAAAVVGVNARALGGIPRHMEQTPTTGYKSFKPAKLSKSHMRGPKYKPGQFNPNSGFYEGGKYKPGTKIKGYYRKGNVYYKFGPPGNRRAKGDVVAKGYSPKQIGGVRTAKGALPPVHLGPANIGKANRHGDQRYIKRYNR